jgi:outer membrane protein TolC
MKRLSIIILSVGMILPIYAQKIYTLKECRELAMQNNVKIKDAKLGVSQALETEKNAFSKYFPTVTAGTVYFHSNDYMMKKDISLSDEEQGKLGTVVSQMGLNPSVLAALPSSYSFNMLKHGTVAQIMAMEPIYAGGQITAGNKLAKLQTDVKKLQIRQSQDEIISGTETYYNQLLTLFGKLRTINMAGNQLERIHKDAENAFKAGLSTKKDMLTVELKQNELVGNRLKVENGIKLCKMVLAQYIGMNGEEIMIDTTLTDNISEPSAFLVDHASALNNKVEAQLLDKNVEANKLQTKLKKGALLPTLSVGAVGLYHDMMGSGQANVVGMATVSVPISGWWSGNHVVKHQKIAEQIACQDREDNRQLLIIQMQSAYNDLDNAYRQILVARKSIEQSTENLRLNEDYYKAGTATMSDLLDAQTSNQQSLDKYTETVCNYLDCKTAYFIATGRYAQ